MSTRIEQNFNPAFFPDNSPFEGFPSPKRLRRHSHPTPKQRKEGEQRASRKSGGDSSITNSPVYAIATPQDIQARMQSQVERFIELSAQGKLPAEWESFAANHREEIATAKKN